MHSKCLNFEIYEKFSSLVPIFKGHMEKQEMEIKRKLKTEMETKDAPITGAIFSS